MEEISKHIEDAERYIEEVHKEHGKSKMEPLKEIKKKELTDEQINKVPLDMQVLKGRIESTQTIQYYKDLKNDRLHLKNNTQLIDDDECLKNMVDDSFDRKPWARLDMYTKKKKIKKFVNDLIAYQKITIDEKEGVQAELFELLEKKKITKKIIDLDSDFNIVHLQNYDLESE